MKERIQKILASVGVASRRAVEEMVLDGRVAVNGKVMRELPILIDAQTDRVLVDGESIELRRKEVGKRYYVLMNKPRHVVCTNIAQGIQKRAVDLLPDDFPARLYPIGRLDADNKGLLILTNDGDLTNLLTHPRYGVPRTYRAVVDGKVSGEKMVAMEQGVYLIDHETGRGFKTGKAVVKVVARDSLRTTLELTIREGKNRQIRRMLAKLGHKVRDLTRIRLGPLTLEGLASGKWRLLTPREVTLLRQSVSVKKIEAKPPSGRATPRGTDYPAKSHATRKPQAKRPAHSKSPREDSGEFETEITD